MKKSILILLIAFSFTTQAKNKFAFPKGTHQIMWYANSELMSKHYLEYTYTPDSSKYAYSVLAGYSNKDLRVTFDLYESPTFNMVTSNCFRLCVGLHRFVYLNAQNKKSKNKQNLNVYGKIDFRYLNETGSYPEEQSSSHDELRQYEDLRISNLYNINGIAGMEIYLLNRKMFLITYYMEAGLGFAKYKLSTLNYYWKLRGSIDPNHYTEYNPPLTDKVNAPKIVFNIGFKLGLKWHKK